MFCDVETQELFPLAEQDQKQDNALQERKPKNLAEFMEMFYPDQKKPVQYYELRRTALYPDDIIPDDEDYDG
jgi:hypothetical protein